MGYNEFIDNNENFCVKFEFGNFHISLCNHLEARYMWELEAVYRIIQIEIIY